MSKKNHLITLGILLLVAAFLRLYRIEPLMRFIWDEGRDMIAIRNIIVHKDITLFGPYNEIDGQKDFFGVFHYYLMLPALWAANFEPVGPAIFTAMLGIAAVGLTYIWANKWTTNNQALAITALMAVSPLVVTYTRWPWNPNTTGFFGILFLLSLQYWQKKPKLLTSLLSGLLLGVLFQLHYFTIALGVAALFVFLWQKIPLQKKVLHMGLFSGNFIFPNLSFVIFDITHQGFYRNILLDSFFSDSSQNFFVVDPLQMLVTIPVTVFGVCSSFIGNSYLGFIVGAIFIWWIISTVRTNWPKQIASEQFQLASSWLAFLAFTAFFPTLLDTYHSHSLWVGIAISLVIASNKLTKRFPLLKSSWVISLVVIFMMLQNKLLRPPFLFENVPKIRAATDAIITDAKKNNQQRINIASLVDSDTRATRFRYFLLKGNIELLDYYSYPQTETLYVISDENWKADKVNPPWEVQSFAEQEDTVLWENDGWQVYKLVK